jgi:hypothetical protein
MSRKPYTKPTVIDLGDAVKQTKGWGGKCWETFGTAYGPPLPKDPTSREQQEKQD